jgi:hypothetical protein
MIRPRPLAAVAAAAAVLTLGGCGSAEEGSGVPRAEERDADDFSRLRVSGEAEVVVRVGPETRVRVEGDDNLLDEVETHVGGETLEVRQEDSVASERGLRVVAETPELDEIEVSGAGDVRVRGIAGEELRVSVSGAGDVAAAGTVQALEVDVSGAGDVALLGLQAREADVDVSGAGDVEVRVAERLSASVSGSGEVRHTGDPAEVDADVSGAGEVRAVGAGV